VEIIQWVLAHKEDMFAIVGAVVVLASAVVLVTPSRKDDEIVGTIRAFLERLSVIKHTEGVVDTSRSVDNG